MLTISSELFVSPRSRSIYSTRKIYDLSQFSCTILKSSRRKLYSSLQLRQLESVSLCSLFFHIRLCSSWLPFRSNLASSKRPFVFRTSFPLWQVFFAIRFFTSFLLVGILSSRNQICHRLANSVPFLPGGWIGKTSLGDTERKELKNCARRKIAFHVQLPVRIYSTLYAMSRMFAREGSCSRGF